MKKSNKVNPKIEKTISDKIIQIEEMLADYGIIIQKNNIDNYRQWMKKPFNGWAMGAKYDKDINYGLGLIYDCCILERTRAMEECADMRRDQIAGIMLKELDRPVQKKRFIATKKMAKK